MTKARYEKLEVERARSNVVITFRCSDEYNAMMLYDHVYDQLAKGGINLNVTTVRSNGEPS